MRKRGFDDLIVALFMPVLTILLSMICLSVTTWAWFTASISTGVNEIKAASTWSTANISSQSASTCNLSTEVGIEPIEVALTDGEFVFLVGNATGNAYKFSITNEGNSHSGYYCLLTFKTADGKVEEIYTANFGSQTIGSNETTFIACLYDDTTVSLQTFWGNPPEDKLTVEEFVELFVPESEESSEETKIDRENEGTEPQKREDSDEPEIEVQQTSPSTGSEIPAETSTYGENSENAEEYTEMQASVGDSSEPDQSTENPTSETETTPTPETGETSGGNGEISRTGEVGKAQTETPTEEKTEGENAQNE